MGERPVTGDGVCRLVFSDLDGSLLDHDNYSFEPARPQLEALESAGIPVIPTTSKTRAEIEALRSDLANPHPFIVENGAAIFIPVGYFAERPEAARREGEFWVRELVAGRGRWVQLLRNLAERYTGEYEYFSNAGTQGIMSMTGLDEAAAARANQRHYSEPVQWRGDPERRRNFIDELVSAGASINEGGRFLSVSGHCDKGRALTWLAAEYVRQRGGSRADTLAIGDSGNDVAMLEAADTALLIRSPAHAFPVLQRREGVIHSEGLGPVGWAEGVATWLAARQLS